MSAVAEYDAKGTTAERDAMISRRVRTKMRQDGAGPSLVKTWLPYSKEDEPGITFYETRHGFVHALRELGFTAEEARNYARDAWNCPGMFVEHRGGRPVIVENPLALRAA